MIGLLQRVTAAEVRVAGEIVGQSGRGLLVLVGVEKNDSEAQADRLLERLLTYRVFPDVGHQKCPLSPALSPPKALRNMVSGPLTIGR